jgi:hypothetical protein
MTQQVRLKSQREWIMEAAVRLARSGLETFSAERLAVEAWKAAPEVFGLEGFESKYPDCNRVLVALMGQRGLAGPEGMLLKRPGKHYSLSERALKLLGLPGPETVPEKDRVELPPSQALGGFMPPSQESYLVHLFSTMAWTRAMNGQQERVSYEEAVEAWRLGDRFDDKEVDAALALSRTYLREAIDFCGERETVTLRCGMVVGREDVRKALGLTDFLYRKFNNQLQLVVYKTRKFRGYRTSAGAGG